MPSAKVPVGIAAPVVLSIPVVTSQAPSLPPGVNPSLMPVHPVQDMNALLVTGIALQGTDPKGNPVNWPGTVPPTNYGTWAPSTNYALNALVVPETATGFYYKCTTAGESGSTPPPFSVTPGQTVQDGAAVWTCIGPATTPTAITGQYAFTGNENLIPGAYQLTAVLTVAGGTIPCAPTVLVVVPSSTNNAAAPSTPVGAVSVSTAGGGGSVVGTAAAPYAVKSTDRFVMCNADSAATQVGVRLSPGLSIGERHTIWFFQWSNAGNPSPLITSLGCQMTVIDPNAQASGQTTAAQPIGQPYSFVTFEWNGTLWVQVV